MIKAVIFDMDGVMIDSEPFWRQAQVEVLKEYGIHFSEKDAIETTGLRIDHIVTHWFQQQSDNFHPRSISSNLATSSPVNPLDYCQEAINMIVDRVIEFVVQNKPMMDGLKEAVALFRQQEFKLAVASSSPLRLIKATLTALELENDFDAVLSAEKLPYGKPHPEVYINAALALGMKPTECLAIEDSFHGLLAAKSALMRTFALPEKAERHQPYWVIADKQLNSLLEINQAVIAAIV